MKDVAWIIRVAGELKLSGDRFAVVPLYPFFDRMVTVAEVPELIPLVYCLGGPKDGWVYDASRAEKREPNGEGFTYEYNGEVAMLPDGRLVRLLAPVSRPVVEGEQPEAHR